MPVRSTGATTPGPCRDQAKASSGKLPALPGPSPPGPRTPASAGKGLRSPAQGKRCALAVRPELARSGPDPGLSLTPSRPRGSRAKPRHRPQALRLAPRDGDLGPPPPRDSPTLNPSYALCPVTGVLQPQLKPSADGEGARVRPLPAPQVAPSLVTSHRTRRGLSQASRPHRVTQPIPQSLCASQAVWTVPLHRPPCTAICGRISPRTRSRAWGHW